MLLLAVEETHENGVLEPVAHECLHVRRMLKASLVRYVFSAPFTAVWWCRRGWMAGWRHCSERIACDTSMQNQARKDLATLYICVVQKWPTRSTAVDLGGAEVWERG